MVAGCSCDRVRELGHARRSCRQGDGGLTPVRPSLGRPLRRRGRRRPARPLVAAALDADPHTAPRSRLRIVAARLEHRRGQDWLGPELGVPARTVSRILRRHDLPRLCALRPADRRGDPRLEDHRRPLRTRTTRRAGPHGRQEDRPDPRRRRLASPRPRWPPTSTDARTDGSATTTSTPSSMTTAGSPTPRSSTTNAPTPAPRSSPRAVELLRRPRHRPIERLMTDNAWSYRHGRRSRELLDRPRHQAQVHQAALPMAERQGRALQPHPRQPSGPTGRSSPATTNAAAALPDFARPLQPPTTPHRPRRSTTHQPTVTNLTAGYS